MTGRENRYEKNLASGDVLVRPLRLAFAHWPDEAETQEVDRLTLSATNREQLRSGPSPLRRLAARGGRAHDLR
jgi:hypothetical protein